MFQCFSVNFLLQGNAVKEALPSQQLYEVVVSTIFPQPCKASYTLSGALHTLT